MKGKNMKQKKNQYGNALILLGIIFLVVGFIAYYYGNNEQQSWNNNSRQLGEINVLLGYIAIILSIIFIPTGLVLRTIKLNEKEIINENPRAILDKRHVKDEITKEQYEQMKKDLKE